MLGFIIGLAGGAAEFFLLKRFVDSVTNNDKISLIAMLLKIIVMICTLLPCAMFIPEQLPFAGIGFAVPIVAGALVCFVSYMVKKPKTEG